MSDLHTIWCLLLRESTHHVIKISIHLEWLLQKDEADSFEVFSQPRVKTFLFLIFNGQSLVLLDEFMFQSFYLAYQYQYLILIISLIHHDLLIDTRTRSQSPLVITLSHQVVRLTASTGCSKIFQTVSQKIFQQQ